MLTQTEPAASDAWLQLHGSMLSLRTLVPAQARPPDDSPALRLPGSRPGLDRNNLLSSAQPPVY